MKEREGEKVTCSNCGAEAFETIGTYPFNESGLSDVQLVGVDLIQCPACGNIDPIIPDVNDLMRALAWHVCTSKYRLGGEEVRFLRKYLHMSATDFAKLLGAHKSTLSKWENGEDPLGQANERLIRSVGLALGEGLKDRIDEGVRSFTWIVEAQRGPMSVDMETLEVQNA